MHTDAFLPLVRILINSGIMTSIARPDLVFPLPVIPVSEVVRIRTGERGEQAERMTGGLSDKLSSVISIS